MEFCFFWDINFCIVGEGNFWIDWVVLVIDFEVIDFYCNIYCFSRDCVCCYFVIIRCGDFEFVVDGFGYGIVYVVFIFTGGICLFRRVY